VPWGRIEPGTADDVGMRHNQATPPQRRGCKPHNPTSLGLHQAATLWLASLQQPLYQAVHAIPGVRIVEAGRIRASLARSHDVRADSTGRADGAGVQRPAARRCCVLRQPLRPPGQLAERLVETRAVRGRICGLACRARPAGRAALRQRRCARRGLRQPVSLGMGLSEAAQGVQAGKGGAGAACEPCSAVPAV
jgi:hypothetical protein